MAYTKHNFVPGMRLAASAMNAIENQLASDAEQVAALKTLSDNETTRINGMIGNLNLTSDGEYIYLKLGNTQISEVKIDDIISDIEGVKPCTGITVTSSSAVSLDKGQTADVTWVVSPTDTTQGVRFLASPMTVITVDSGGTITAVKAGVGTVTARCGSHHSDITVYVSEYVIPKFDTVNWINGGTNKINFTQNGAEGALGFGTMEESVIKVPAGFTISGTTIGRGSQYGHNDCYWMNWYGFSPTDTTNFSLDSNEYAVINNVTNVTAVEFLDTYKKTFSVDCTSETWFVGILRGDSGFVSPSNKDTFITTYPNILSITIAPTR